MPKLIAATPVVVPQTEAATYPHLWLANMNINANDPNGKVSLNGRLIPYRDLPDGTKELAPRVRALQVNIPDVFAVIAADPTGPVAQAFGAVILALADQVPDVSGVE